MQTNMNPQAPLAREQGRTAPPPAETALVLDEKALRLLRRSGLRPTCHRLSVLQALSEAAPRALRADQIHRSTVAAGSSIGLVSVYRVLQELRRADLVARRLLPGGCSIYALDEGGSSHLIVCSRCGASRPLDDALLLQNASRVASVQGLPAGSRLQIVLQTDCLGCGSASSTRLKEAAS